MALPNLEQIKEAEACKSNSKGTQFDQEDVVWLDQDEDGGSRFRGKVHYFTSETTSEVSGALDIHTKSIDVEKTEEMPPFIYLKPVIGNNKLEVTGKAESEPRKKYYPLMIVENALKGPNHWPDQGIAVFCAVEVSPGNWETRYFPKAHIDTEGVWEEVERICAERLVQE